MCLLAARSGDMVNDDISFPTVARKSCIYFAWDRSFSLLILASLLSIEISRMAVRIPSPLHPCQVLLISDTLGIPR